MRIAYPAKGFCPPCALERCLARGEELPYATHPALWDPEHPDYDPADPESRYDPEDR
jgi:hypothetical protein